jgi:uncharacterized protein YcgI (DUF1989 family)
MVIPPATDNTASLVTNRYSPKAHHHFGSSCKQAIATAMITLPPHRHVSCFYAYVYVCASFSSSSLNRYPRPVQTHYFSFSYASFYSW